MTHLLNGMLQNVHERYTINKAVEHKFFNNILHPVNRFCKAFQKQAIVTDGQRVCLLCFKVLFYLSHCKRLTKGLVRNGFQIFSQKIYESVPAAKNQQIQSFHYLKYARICAENIPHKNEVFR